MNSGDGDRSDAAEPRPFRRRIILNTASIGAANGWAIAVAVVSLPLLLRGLGPVAFGTWVLLQSLSAVNGWFSLLDVGLGTATTRELAGRAALDDQQGMRKVLGTAVLLFGSLALVGTLLLASLGPLALPRLFSTPTSMRSDLVVAIWLVAIQVSADILIGGLQACLEGFQRVDLSRLSDVVRRTLAAIGASVAALAGKGLVGVAAASLGGSVIGAVLAAALLWRLAGGTPGRPSWPVARALLAYGTSLSALNTTAIVAKTMDRAIVGLFLGPTAVTVVEIATQVTNGANAVLSAATYAVLPATAWVRARGDHRALKEVIVRGTLVSVLVSAPIMISVMALAYPLVGVWVGHGYDRAVLPLEVSMLALLVSTPMQVGSNFLQGAGKAGLMLRPVVAAQCVNLVLSVLLVRSLGVTGVFIGTLAASAIYVVPLGRAALGESGVAWPTYFRRGLLPAVPPLTTLGFICLPFALLPVPDSVRLLGGLGIGFCGYLAVTWRFAITRGEVADFIDVIRPRRP